MDGLNIVDKDTYYKKCNIIIELIKTTYKNSLSSISTNINEYTLLIEIIFNDKHILTLRPEQTWNQIKMYINKHVINAKCEEQCEAQCEVCDSKYNHQNRRVNCNMCSNSYCKSCYKQLFIAGKGIIKCPYCRSCFGIEMPNYLRVSENI